MAKNNETNDISIKTDDESNINDCKYILSRLDNQINWYDSNSMKNKKIYKRFMSIQIVCSALIPFLTGYVDNHILIKLAVGILGVIITIIATLLNLNKYHENWIEYRSIAESLKHEKMLYLSKSGPYNTSLTQTPYNNLVERIESLISKENIRWSNYMKKVDDQKKE